MCGETKMFRILSSVEAGAVAVILPSEFVFDLPTS
jgi:hypothetical protein